MDDILFMVAGPGFPAQRRGQEGERESEEERERDHAGYGSRVRDLGSFFSV